MSTARSVSEVFQNPWASPIRATTTSPGSIRTSGVADPGDSGPFHQVLDLLRVGVAMDVVPSAGRERM